MPELKLLFLQIAAIFAAARLMTFRFIGQPAVMGEMAAGILLGPSLLGRIAAAVMERFSSRWRSRVTICTEPAGDGAVHVSGRSGSPAASIRGSAKSVVVASEAGDSIRAWAAASRGCRSCCFWGDDGHYPIPRFGAASGGSQTDAHTGGGVCHLLRCVR